MNMNFLEIIRKYELEKIISELHNYSSRKLKILEIGAGSGWQSKVFSNLGHEVHAIDLEDGTYSKHEAWPIKVYDGSNIPFETGSFDIVFSSNVLEHIPHVVLFQKEIHRVLKDDGLVIHILPSVAWRFWTNIAHVIAMLKLMLNMLQKKSMTSDVKSSDVLAEKIVSMSLTMKIKKILLPVRHGEFGNAVSELFYFSVFRWNRLFAKTNWLVEKRYSNNLFYSGYMTFGPKITISTRVILSKFLGSSCNIFVLRKERGIE